MTKQGLFQEKKIVSIDVERAYDKIQYLCITQTFRKLGIQGNFLIMIKGIY